MKWYWTTVTTVIVVLTLYGGFGLTRHVIVAFDKWGDAAPKHLDTTIRSLDATAQRANVTLDLINRPCGAKDAAGKLLAPGTLCQVNKTVTYLGDTAVTTQRQVAQADRLVESAASSLQITATAVAKTSDSATDLLRVASGQLVEVGPTLASGRRAADSLDALLRDEAVHRTLDNVAGMTASGDLIMKDARRVADKATDDYVTPKPWYIKLRTYGGDLFDLTAFAARHAH